MGFFKQLFYLMKQELRSATRSRYILISFIFLPLFMWTMEGGVQVILTNVATSTPSSQTIYITNQDTGNVSLIDNFTLPFDFNGKSAGQNITSSDNFSLSNYFVQVIKWNARYNNNSALYNSKVVDNESVGTIENLKNDGKVDYWLKIDSSFSKNYTELGRAYVQMEYLQKGFIDFSAIQLSINQILTNKPFTIVEVKKVGGLVSTPITIGGDQSSISLGVGLAGFLAILLAVLAPAPFVSTAFAGEREKKTLESLLALPISRKGILLGKLMSGMVLVGIFAVANVIGMYIYNALVSEATIGDNGSVLSFDLNVTTIFAISVTMFLSAFIAIGLGMSIASFAKDVRTSESMYQFILMIPAMLTGFVGMFAGVPENLGGPALLLYVIPFTHSLAIFQKLLRPGYYDVKSLTGFGLIGDLTFHFVYLVLSIAVVLYLASKVFEREGIVN